jgi:hypothetical protein
MLAMMLLVAVVVKLKWGDRLPGRKEAEQNVETLWGFAEEIGLWGR